MTNGKSRGKLGEVQSSGCERSLDEKLDGDQYERQDEASGWDEGECAALRRIVHTENRGRGGDGSVGGAFHLDLITAVVAKGSELVRIDPKVDNNSVPGRSVFNAVPREKYLDGIRIWTSPDPRRVERSGSIRDDLTGGRRGENQRWDGNFKLFAQSKLCR